MIQVNSFEEFMSYIDWNDLDINQQRALYDVFDGEGLDLGIFKLTKDDNHNIYKLVDTMDNIVMPLTDEQKMKFPRWLEQNYLNGENGDAYFSLQEELQKDSEVGIIEYQDSDDLENIQVADVIVYSRDWTVATICDQIQRKNIELNPTFQRRNAWNDSKRSRLIESIMMGYPVPEIVLAENPKKKGSFIVIDGKQRLLTIAGFVSPNDIGYWTRPQLTKLTVRADIKGNTYEDFKKNDEYRDTFDNTALRCTVIANYKDEQILYDIFYRLNTGSSPLSSQELRQALHPGEFANFLLKITSTYTTLHEIMSLSASDNRLRDVEVLLRIYAFLLFPNDYKGNLRQFLDEKLKQLNELWDVQVDDLQDKYQKIDVVLRKLCHIFGGGKNVSRKWTNGKWDIKFNRVLLEVLVYYFMQLYDDNLTNDEKDKAFVQEYQALFSNDEFRSSLESSTKSIPNYKLRYDIVKRAMHNAYGVDLKNPFE